MIHFCPSALITRIMNKPSLIVTFLHPALRRSTTGAVLVVWAAFSVVLMGGTSLFAQDEKSDSKADSAKADDPSAEPIYPLAVAVDGADIYAVDLDLPGVWKTGESRELYVRGTNLLRKPMNRPRCVILHPGGGILVGDSATREIYHIESAGAEPKPLLSGGLGIVMAMALGPDGKYIYAGDAEKRATFRVPIEGGTLKDETIELVARVNARGLAFDSDGKLWAVTPDDAAIQKIDVQSKEVEKVVTGRPFQYPNGLCWAGDHGYVTDGYGKCIWKFTADGKTEKWHEGDPLVGPVGIAVSDDSVYVADPKQKQVYQFNRETKEPKERL